jgi:hypothetical protein
VFQAVGDQVRAIGKFKPIPTPTRIRVLMQFDKEASQACDIASQRTRRFARLAQIAFDYAQARLSRRKERLLQDDNQTAPPESGSPCRAERATRCTNHGVADDSFRMQN